MEITINSKTFGVKNVLFDSDDYELIKIHKWHVIKIGDCFYAETCIGLKRVRMHRLVMSAVKNQIIDHEDHNGLNNQKSNLRYVTTSQNSMNQRLRKNNASGFRGVYFHKVAKKYHAQIKVDGKRKSLGLFDKSLDAAIAYNNAAITFYKEYAQLNTI